MDFLSPNREKRKAIKAYFAEKYSGVEINSIGKSILGEALEVYRLGAGQVNILYVGTHHASEHLTASLLYNFIDGYLSKKSAVFGVDTRLLATIATIWVLPILNPDGAELCIGGAYENPLMRRQIAMSGGGDFTHWQANARGVDLNHNYDAGFTEYKEIEMRDGIFRGSGKYSGEYPESEPETRAVANLVRTINPSLTVSLHTQGEEIYFSPRTARVQRLSASLAADIGYRVAYPSGSAKYGGLCDYTGSLGIPSLTLELGLGKNPLPISHAEPIYSRVGGSLITLPTLL